MALYPLNLPDKAENAVICVRNPKTAALLFDRVWSFRGDLPAEIRLYGETDLEDILLYSIALNYPRFARSDPVPFLLQMLHQTWNDGFGHDDEVITLHEVDELRRRIEHHSEELALHLRSIAETISSSHGISIPVLLDNEKSFSDQYTYGNASTVVSVLNSVPIIDEDQLEWEQVIELRKDRATRKELARLIHFFDREWVGKPTAFIVHDLEYKLEAYRAGLRKHGISTVLGTLKTIASSKWVTGAAAISGTAASFGNTTAALSAAAAMVTSCAISIAEELRNLKDFEATNKPLAFVHSLQQKYAPGDGKET